MNLRFKHLLSRQTINNLSRLTALSSTSTTPILNPNLIHNRNINQPCPSYNKFFHILPELKFPATQPTVSDEESDEDAAVNEFLSRFVHQMRGKVNEAYPNCDKKTVDAMLVLIVEKLVAQMEKGEGLEKMEMGELGKVDFSEDLWKTVLDVSNVVYEDMEREKKKERMKKFLQSEDVKALARFASEVGVRGDMLRELRFKWARETMEESEFYEGLEEMKKKAEEDSLNEGEQEGIVGENKGEVGSENKDKGGLPKRHGKIKYKLYGLDLSNSIWKEMADRVHEAEEMIWPQEAKPITEKCKLVYEKIVSMGEDDDPLPLIAEWVELLQPNRANWVNLLEKLREQSHGLNLKVAEHVLAEPSFQADIRDYSKLIDIHAKENRLEDAERILEKMSKNGMEPDIIILTTLVHMYSKTGNLESAKEAFDKLERQGFKPDKDVYSAMVYAYANAGEPKMGESLLRQAETRDIKPSEELCIALLRGFARLGDLQGAYKVDTTMRFAGYQPSLESCTLLIETCAKSGKSVDARNVFDYMLKLGIKPDDTCTAIMVSVYAGNNALDKALNLLLHLEKDGFEPGISTYCVLVDWLAKLQLVDETEQMLRKITQLGETPPLKIQVSLCDMYSRVGNEKKALQALGVLESKKELLESVDFERVIGGLKEGGFEQDALRIVELMKAQGFTPPLLMSTQAFGSGNINKSRIRIR